MKNKISISKVLVAVLVIFTVTSCNRYKKEAESLSASKDSIQSVVNERDSKILEYVQSYNEIQQNLDSIKAIQKIVNVSVANGTELGTNQKDQIVNDIALINNLLEENKKLVESLKKKLGASSKKIAELEKMVAYLTQQAADKDVEIAKLTTELQEMRINVSDLNQKVDNLTTENKVKDETITSKTNEMNVAFYAYGSKDELIKNNVVEKVGGVIGIGKTYKMKKDFNKDYFTKIDIRKFSNLPLMVKKAEIVTTHPLESFHVSGEKRADTLYVDNSAEFWKVSKYLVVVVAN